jgi:TonB-linked SusC/RagA family outer membrane protein
MKFGKSNTLKFQFMRLYNNIYEKLRFAGMILLCLFIASNASGQAQKERRARQTVNVTFKVTDEAGAPIPGAAVVVGEGVIHTEADDAGSVTFTAYPEDFVTVSAPSYEKSVLLVTDIIQTGAVALGQSKLYMTSDDDVPLPFATMKKRHITGPEITIDAARLAKYPTNDLRNAFTGLTSGWDVRELYGWPGVSAMENLGQYGATDKFSNMPVAIVDGIYTDLSEMHIDISEIESITINKGILGNAMFGPVAANGGSIFIKTKRGAKNERLLDVNLESGVSVIDRMPGYVGGGDYASLNNTARAADGLAELYTPAAITEYSKNDPYNMYYPSIHFRDLMIKNTMAFRRAGVSSSGGNDVVQYYSYVGYDGQGDIYNMGAKADFNKISTRQNVDVKVNDFVSVDFSFYGNVSIRRSPNYGWDPDFTSENTSSNPVLGLIEMPAVMTDIREIPPIAFPVYARIDEVSGVPWYGVGTTYRNNPIGNLEAQGYYVETGRMGASSIALNFDFAKLIPGLKSTTFVGFNIYNQVRQGQAEDYDAYVVTPSVSAATGNDTILLTKSSAHALANQTSMARLMDYYYQRYAFYESLDYTKSFGESDLQTTLTYYIGKTFKNGIEEPERQQNLIWHTLYSLKDKYSAELVLNYAGTYSFAEDNRYKLFPTAGLGWVISDENFMSGVGAIDYLKLRAQAGMLGVETFLSPFYYETRLSQNTSGSAFGPISTNTWFGTTTDANVPRTNPQRIGNPDLGWEIYKEFNAGFDALLFNKQLSLSMSYLSYLDDGAVVQVSNVLPYAAGLQAARPYYNYTQLKGQYLLTDLILTKKVGGLTLSLGGNVTTGVEKRVKYDEPNYTFDYQKRTGRPSDAIFGMEYLGKFSTDADAMAEPQLFDAELKAGDLQYADLNGDGFIDDTDQQMIGNSAPRMYYGITAQLRYKGFELFVHGAGRAFYDLALTNAYYWNGWGDNNYSNFVRDNIGGAYPRLTYYRINNNFLTSDFWLTKGDYFKIQNIELAYTIPAKAVQFLGSQGIRLYVRGANLLTLSGVKDVDPESINSGITNYPLFKTFTGGVKLNF